MRILQQGAPQHDQSERRRQDQPQCRPLGVLGDARHRCPWAAPARWRSSVRAQDRPREPAAQTRARASARAARNLGSARAGFSQPQRRGAAGGSLKAGGRFQVRSSVELAAARPSRRPPVDGGRRSRRSPGLRGRAVRAGLEEQGSSGPSRRGAPRAAAKDGARRPCAPRAWPRPSLGGRRRRKSSPCRCAAEPPRGADRGRAPPPDGDRSDRDRRPPPRWPGRALDGRCAATCAAGGDATEDGDGAAQAKSRRRRAGHGAERVRREITGRQLGLVPHRRQRG